MACISCAENVGSCNTVTLHSLYPGFFVVAVVLLQRLFFAVVVTRLTPHTPCTHRLTGNYLGVLSHPHSPTHNDILYGLDSAWFFLTLSNVFQRIPRVCVYLKFVIMLLFHYAVVIKWTLVKYVSDNVSYLLIRQPTLILKSVNIIFRYSCEKMMRYLIWSPRSSLRK